MKHHSKVKITEDCVGYEVNIYDEIIGHFTLFKNEIHLFSSSYDYYDKDDEYWGTELPIIKVKINENDSINLRLPPDCFEFVDEFSVSNIENYQLIERYDTTVKFKDSVSAANKMINSYLNTLHENPRY